jgi:hypothetical protein
VFTQKIVFSSTDGISCAINTINCNCHENLFPIKPIKGLINGDQVKDLIKFLTGKKSVSILSDIDRNIVSVLEENNGEKLDLCLATKPYPDLRRLYPTDLVAKIIISKKSFLEVIKKRKKYCPLTLSLDVPNNNILIIDDDGYATEIVAEIQTTAFSYHTFSLRQNIICNALESITGKELTMSLKQTHGPILIETAGIDQRILIMPYVR